MSEGLVNHIDTEYVELNNHVRECWKYISELLKSFLFVQIILISVIFLGGGVPEFRGITIQANASAAGADGEKVDTHKMNVAAPVRDYAIVLLLFIGFVGSAGALMQNDRLFRNATTYVRRAAFLESDKGFAKDNREQEIVPTQPPCTYMWTNLYSGRGLDLKVLLALTYGFFAIVWFSYGVFALSVFLRR
jgi:hypothetical protein